MSAWRRLASLAVVLTTLTFVPSPTPPRARSVDVGGGVLSDADGTRVAVPSGAVSQPTEITIGPGRPVTTDPDSAAGPPIRLHAPGTRFAESVEVTIPCEDSSRPGLVVLKRDEETGEVLRLIPRPAGPHHVTVDVRSFSTFQATGTIPRFLYVANMDSGTVSIYTVNSTTGVLRPRGYTYYGAGSLLPICVDPSSKFLIVGSFGATNGAVSYTIDPLTGLLTATTGLQATVPAPNDITFTKNGLFLYYPDLNNNTVGRYAVNATTGALTFQSSVASGVGPEIVVHHPTLNVVYVPSYFDQDIARYSVDASTGALTEQLPRVVIGAVGAGTFTPISMAVTPDGLYAFVANYDGNSITRYSIAAGTGALTALGTTTAGVSNPTSLVAVRNAAGSTAPRTVNNLYVANDGNNTIQTYTIAANGTPTLHSTDATGGNPSRVSMEPSGKMIWVTNRTTQDVSVYRVDLADNDRDLLPMGTVRAQQSPTHLAVAAGAGTVTYTPRFAYCSNSAADTISCYSVNNTTGALTPLATPTVASGGDMPLWVTIPITGRFLYCLNRDDSLSGNRGIQVFSINATTGALTPLPGLVATDANPRRSVIEPSGRFFYVAHDASNTIWVYSIDQTTGALTLVPGGVLNTAVLLWGMGVDPSGQFLVVGDRTNNRTLSYAIDPATGLLTFVAASAAQGTDPRSADVDPSGRFVFSGNLTGAPDMVAYTLSATGAFGTIGTADAGGTQTIQVAIEPTGRFLYAANFGSNDVGRYTINTTTGALTSNGLTGVGTRPQGITVDPSGRFVYVPNSGSDNVSCFSINATTGALTAVGTVAAGDAPHTVAVLVSVQ